MNSFFIHVIMIMRESLCGYNLDDEYVSFLTKGRTPVTTKLLQPLKNLHQEQKPRQKVRKLESKRYLMC